MVTHLEDSPDKVGAYSDFYIINESGEVIEDFKNVEWNFIDALSAFSCYPAAPGAVIRRSAFKSLRNIKDGTYKYINDIKMLWDFALKGDFVYINKSLASWRSHSDGISADRYKSVGEVRKWADEYFARIDLPKEVKNIEEKCRRSIDSHCARLIINSDVNNVVTEYLEYLDAKREYLIDKNNALIDKNNALESEKSSLEQEIIDIKQSASWRITKPFRNARRILSKIINKLTW